LPAPGQITPDISLLNISVLLQLGNVPANMAYFGGYELGKKLVPGQWGDPFHSTLHPRPCDFSAASMCILHMMMPAADASFLAGH
jgi:hypothetical protein